MMLPKLIDDPLKPVTLTRLAPDPDGGWPDSQSWLGGVPYLGEARWPSGKNGAPLTHLASISLKELSPFIPAGKVPTEGMLAFFIGSVKPIGGELETRVLHVNGTMASEAPFTRADNVFRRCERLIEGRLDRFPIWLTEREPVSSRSASQQEKRQSAFEVWSTAMEEGEAALYWDVAYHLLFGLKDVFREGCIDNAIEFAEQTASQHQYGTKTDLYLNSLIKLDALRNRLNPYRHLVQDIQDKVLLHERWTAMSSDDVEWLGGLFDQLKYNTFHNKPHENTPFGAIYSCGSFFQHGLYAAKREAFWRIVQTPAPVLGELSADVLSNLGYEPGIAPIQRIHQMFGYGCSEAYAWYMDHYQLLQIECDSGAGLDLRGGIFHFVIAPDDLKARRWHKVKLAHYYD